MPIGAGVLGNEIGRGAFGVVYEYSDAVLERKDALKRICFEEVLIKHQWTNIPKILQEVNNSKELIHDNVVQYIDSWLEGPDTSSIADGTFLPPDISSSSIIPRNNFLNIQMELCDISLAKIIALHSNEGNSLNISQLLAKYVVHSPQKTFLQLCKGLEAIHEAEIIHRDLQPGNIFIKTGIWKIGDFGLSRKESDEKSTDRGTRLFHSPEMYRGDKDYSYDSDIYSLGLILLLILNRSLQTNKYFMTGIFHELKVAKDPSEAMADAEKDVDAEFSIELSTIKKMIARNRNERLNLYGAIKQLSNADRIDQLTRNLIPLLAPKERHENYRYPSNLTLPENNDGFFGKKEEMSEILTTLQISINAKMLPSLNEHNIKLIFVQGQPSTGKSYFVKHTLALLNDCNLVWIECVEIMDKYKSFLRNAKDEIASKTLAPWILVFDELDHRSIACFTIIMKALFGNLCIYTRPTCVIFTSSVINKSGLVTIFDACAKEWSHGDGDLQHYCNGLKQCPVVPPTFTFSSYSMDYFWTNEMLEDNLRTFDLRKLIYCIFKKQSQNKDTNEEVLFFSGSSPSYVMLDAVLQAFISQGVILSVALNNTKMFQFAQDGNLYQNTILSTPCKELFQIILEHPISVHILQNVLDLDELQSFRKLLEYLKQNNELDLHRTFFKQVLLVKKWGQWMAAHYETLINEYPDQLHTCVQDIMDLALIIDLHSKCLEKFGHFHPATIKFTGTILQQTWFETISTSHLESIVMILNNQTKALENLDKSCLETDFIVKTCKLIFSYLNSKMNKLYREKQPEMAIAYCKLLLCIGSILEKHDENKIAWSVYLSFANSPEKRPALEEFQQIARLKILELNRFVYSE